MPGEDPQTSPTEIDGGARPFVLRHAVATYGTNMLVAALSLANVLIVSRALGPIGRGGVAFLTTLAGLSAQIALLGIHRAIANLAPREPEKRRELATNAAIFSLVLGAAAIGAVALLVALVPAAASGQPTSVLWLAMLSIPIVTFHNCMAQLVRVHYGHGVANVAWTLGPITNAVVNGLLAVTGVLSVSHALATWVGGQVLTAIVLTWYVSRRLSGFGRPDAGLARRMFGFGIKTHAGQVMLVGNYRLDQWVLGAVGGSRELGLYSVAVAWSEMLFFLPTALQAVQRPDLIRASREVARERAALIFRTCLLLTGVLALIVLLLAPFLCITVFGRAFADSVPQLRVLVLGSFGITALKLLGDALTSQGKPLLETASIGGAFVVIVILDIVLIPSHGGIGASIASVVAYSVGGISVVLIAASALGARFRDLIPRGRSDLLALMRRPVASD